MEVYRLRHARGAFAVLLLSTAAGCSSEELFAVIGGELPFNFHEVDAGRMYRSAQPSGPQLIEAIETFGIKTVVNLRGMNVGEAWYDEEAAVVQMMDVTHVNHRMSANSLPSPELIVDIIETLETAEYPILVHCQSGADRTGAISAIYRMLIMGDPKAEALEELSPRYWHFRSRTPCMDTLAEFYEPTADWIDTYAAEFGGLVCTP